MHHKLDRFASRCSHNVKMSSYNLTSIMLLCIRLVNVNTQMFVVQEIYVWRCV